jgi:DNA-binding response OmpR family regulator
MSAAIVESHPEVRTGRILLVDDEEIFRRTVAAILSDHGYRCDAVDSTSVALAVLSQEPYDLLIADVNIPGNQRLEFLQAAQSGERWLPIIVVTAFPTIQSAVESLRLSVVDYMVKPTVEAELLDRVRKGIEKGRMMSNLRRAQQEMATSVERLEGLQQSMQLSSDRATAKSFALTVDHFVSMTMSNIAQSATSLKKMVDVMKSNQPAQSEDLCAMIRCPRLAQYEKALRETIEVLEKTKNSFKSRELADLRKNVESILNQPRC